MSRAPELRAPLPKDVRALEVARQFVADRLSGQAEDIVDDAKLVASEFVTAVILCGQRPREITVSVDETAATIRVTVAGGHAQATAAAPFVLEPLGESIVSRVARRWGADVDEAGDGRFWCEICRLNPAP